MGEICEIMNASSSQEIINNITTSRSSCGNKYEIPIEPYDLTLTNVIPELRNNLDSQIASFTHAKNANESRLSLAPSNGSRFCGGKSVNDSSFRSSLLRYFREMFPKMIMLRGSPDH